MQLSGFTRWLWLGLAVAVISGPAPPAPDSQHLRMGNPSHATANIADKNNFLMVKEYFVLSYNNVKGTPNWVSWRLSKQDTGTAGRPPFYEDSTLPDGFKRITPSDYSGSGFDRGHMCPHSDRSKDAASSKSTFVMTNMVPQSPENNQRAWNQMEIYLRDLVVKKDKVCYIVSGPSGMSGVGRNGPLDRTANGRVVVPHSTWKVVLVLDEDVTDPTLLTEHSNVRLIGVIIPNDKTPGMEWAPFRVPVEQVEALTGYTFFEKVPAAALRTLKAEHDEIPIPLPSPTDHNDL